MFLLLRYLFPLFKCPNIWWAPNSCFTFANFMSVSVTGETKFPNHMYDLSRSPRQASGWVHSDWWVWLRLCSRHHHHLNSTRKEVTDYFAWECKGSSVLFCFLIFKIYSFIYLFIHLWLCWVFVSVRGLSLVAASGGHSSSRCAGLSLQRPLLLRSTGSRRAGSVVVATGLVAPRHVGSSQTRAWTLVPCIGRQILNHCATREAQVLQFKQRDIQVVLEKAEGEFFFPLIHQDNEFWCFVPQYFHL